MELPRPNNKSLPGDHRRLHQLLSDELLRRPSLIRGTAIDSSCDVALWRVGKEGIEVMNEKCQLLQRRCATLIEMIPTVAVKRGVTPSREMQMLTYLTFKSSWSRLAS